MERLAPAGPAVRSLWMILLAAVAAPMAGEPAHAQLFFYTWNNPGGGSYHNNLNWSPFGVPNSANEDASFDLDAEYTVDFTSDVVAGAVTVLDGTVTFDLDVGGPEHTYSIGPLWAIGPGHLRIADGNVAAGQLLVREGGKITVLLGKGSLSAGGDIHIDGGTLDYDRNAFETVMSPGTSLIVRNGGSFTGQMRAGGGCTITVTGIGSTINSRPFLYSGLTGPTTVIVENGATFNGTLSSVESATVTGPGSTLTGSVSLGFFDHPCSLTIRDGAAVSGTGGSIAISSGQDGTAIVEAGASWTIGGDLWIGGYEEDVVYVGGKGLLTIAGGSVEVGEDTVLFPEGKVQLYGGTLTAGTIRFQGAEQFQQFHWLAGTLHVDEFARSLFNEGGVLSPGRSIGATAVGGSYFQAPGATLAIELGPAGHDVVSIAHNVALYGQLRLTLVDGFVPGPQQTFVILLAGSLSGAFDNAANGQRLGTADGEGSFVVHYGPDSAHDPQQVVLADFAAGPVPTPTPACFTWGDMNGDGVAGAVDAAQILQFDTFLLDCFPIDTNCDGRGPEDAVGCAQTTKR